MTVILIVIALVVVVGIIWAAATYNSLVVMKLRVETQWKQIDVVLKKRSDLIPNVVECVKAYSSYEKDSIDKITGARSKMLGAGDRSGQIAADGELSGAINRLFALAESYPELKANANYLELQKQLKEIENKIADYRQFYNDTVLRYNTLVHTVPSSIIAGMFHFTDAESYMVADSDKQPVKLEL